MERMNAFPDPAEAVLAESDPASAGRVELFLWLRAASDPRLAIEAALRAAGGGLVWSARAERLVIGDGELHWTHAALAQGPSERGILEVLRRSARGAGLLEVASRRFQRQRLPTSARVLLGLMRFVGRWRRPAPPDASMFELPAGLAPSALNPPIERLRELAADRSPAAAFMINLLAYRERAEYPEASRSAGSSGRAAYRRYGAVAARSVALLGGAIQHIGRLEGGIGDPPGLATSGSWDELAIVRYPRPSSLVQLDQMPGYARALAHRNAGLARTALVVAR
jgi:hypothetical protein